MSISDDFRAELDAEAQRQAEQQALAEAQADAAARHTPTRFADPTRGNRDAFNFVESRGFLTVLLESFLVNFGPNPDNEAAWQRGLYFDVAGFTRSDPATDHRMQFARIASTNAPPPVGNADLSDRVAPVTNFSRGTGRAVESVYESFDEIYGERLASAAREVQGEFSRVAANIDEAPTQQAQINYAPGLLTPAA